MQTLNAESSVIPFIEETFKLKEGLKVLEVGCAEGGVLKAFVKRGCYGVGVELDQNRKEMAEQFMALEISENKCRFINKNIYDATFESEFHEMFDLIVLKDVIEHIHEQQKVMFQLYKFLKPEGKIFFGFPPWRMPFGGHQQIAQSKFLSKLPYFHLLPMGLYRWVLKSFGEHPDGLVEIKETGISIARFEKISKNAGFQIENELHYLINPIYAYKFGLKTRIQFPLIKKIPYFRDFVTTAVFYLLKK